MNMSRQARMSKVLKSKTNFTYVYIYTYNTDIRVFFLSIDPKIKQITFYLDETEYIVENEISQTSCIPHSTE